MDVAEMIRNVVSECKPITNVNAKIIRDLDRGQKIVFSKRQWGWAFIKDFSFTTVAGVETYALSQLVDVSKIVKIGDPSGNNSLNWITESEYREKFPANTTATGNPYYSRWSGFSAVQFQPSVASVLEFVSDNLNDTTQTIFIQGLDDNGIMASEVVTLNGIVPVVSTVLFSRILVLSKSAVTLGAVTVTSNAGAVTNIRLLAGERSVSLPLISLYPIPAAARVMPYSFYMKAQTLSATTDVSLIPEQYHDAPELYAKSRLYKHLNRHGEGNDTYQEFLNRINDMENDDNHARGIWSRDSSVGNGDPRTRDRIIMGI